MTFNDMRRSQAMDLQQSLCIDCTWLACEWLSGPASTQYIGSTCGTQGPHNEASCPHMKGSLQGVYRLAMWIMST